MIQLSTFSYQLLFRQPAGTSRGVYTTRKVWYVLIRSKEYPERWGIGECAPLPDLSCDDLPEYEKILLSVCREIEKNGVLDVNALREYPSMVFGLETAFRQFERGSFALWDTPFSHNETGIPINGLIWMNDYPNMLEQIEAKLKAGFRCIKLKIGAIRFEEELALLRHIRKHFSSDDIELRVDANGAFSPEEALDKLKRLAELDIHSIEQPIRAGQWEEMAQLTALSPIPIALDEELIGCNYPDRKRELLDAISPQYIILKPSLHGGITGCNEWIEEAEKRQIGWWVTSALESNIGLNAIAQWCASLLVSPQRENIQPVYQGLGTGGLFTNNIEMPLVIKRDKLWFMPSSSTPPSTPQPPKGGADPSFLSFLSEWFSDSPYITVRTSGSTGEPKLITVEKKRMKYSAQQTCEFLQLNKGDTALLCMPLQYIGAKMMVVRSLVHELHLIIRKASGHPLKDVDSPLQLAAMTPQQVYNSLQDRIEKERLSRIENLIIGGSAIDPSLEEELKQLPNKIYSTYGMTETLSHIALRRINGKEASPYYTAFPSVKLSLSSENTLIIDAPMVCDKPIFTNDVAEILPDGRFKITGRKDNRINSGGIKIQAEVVEEKLRAFYKEVFAITSIPDPKFGEAIVLVARDCYDKTDISRQIADLLSRYEQPKHILYVDSIPLAGNGKIDRKACREMVLRLLKPNDI